MRRVCSRILHSKLSSATPEPYAIMSQRLTSLRPDIISNPEQILQFLSAVWDRMDILVHPRGIDSRYRRKPAVYLDIVATSV